jgi:hypothetical protein
MLQSTELAGEMMGRSSIAKTKKEETAVLRRALHSGTRIPPCLFFFIVVHAFKNGTVSYRYKIGLEKTLCCK